MDIGVIGLAAMGQNLVLNIESRGFSVAVYNRTAEKTRTFIKTRTAGKKIEATYEIKEFILSLSHPRKVFLMVKAGDPTDTLIETLLPLLEPGDVLMDGGNALFNDTDRRCKAAEELGILYLGVGVSGGEIGALLGPAIMAGGSENAYRIVEPILESIAAVGPQGHCCSFFGPRSAGHYIKMVHNGIEYTIMQALCEAYDLMHRGLSMSADEIADVFQKWNKGELESYLVAITEKILRQSDPEGSGPLVGKILDSAEQKGTGKWSSQSALDLGAPSPSIAAAIFARIISSLKSERIIAEPMLSGPSPNLSIDKEVAIRALFSATLCASISAYGQGFRQLLIGSKEHNYGLDLAEVARVWMAGCIIRSRLLVPIGKAFQHQSDLSLLLLAEPFRSLWEKHQSKFRKLVAAAHEAGIPVPVMSSSLNFVDAYRTNRLPANLLQAQRDFFGAHTYQRIDRDGTYHTKWEQVQ